MTACASVEKTAQLPVLPANWFETETAPLPPSNERLSEPDGDKAQGIYITRLDSALMHCEAKLSNARNTLEIMGFTITDTAVTEQKEPRRKLFGIF